MVNSIDYKLDHIGQIHKHSVRLVHEEVVLSPHKLTLVYDGDDWEKDSVDDYQETSRTELKMESIFEGASERAEANFEHAIQRLKTKQLAKCQLKDVAGAIAYGFTQPEAKDLTKQEMRNIISELVASMNSRQLIHNDDVGTVVADAYAELKI